MLINAWQNIVIDKQALKESVKNGMTIEFYDEEDYVEFMEQERLRAWQDEYPEPFKTEKDTRMLATHYLIKTRKKYYLVGNDEELEKIIKQ